LTSSEPAKHHWTREPFLANEILDLVDYPETIKVMLRAIRIGGLGIVTTPCETFVETGLVICQTICEVVRREGYHPTFCRPAAMPLID